MPPTSAWWARLATKPKRRGFPSSSTKMGVMTVMSGRCVPPRKGSLRITTSPGSKVCSRSAWATERGMDPRWTGMCAAWATIFPSASKRAQEKSRRSLMLGE